MPRRFGHWYRNDKSQKLRKRRNKNKSKDKKIELPRKNDQVIEIGSWNVEEKGSPEEIDKILSESKEKPDVICLQRAKLPAADTDTENYKWLCSGTTGSAVLIKKSSNIISNSFEKFCDNICMTELTGKADYKISIISCYIPPVTDYTCEELWKKLREILGNISHLSFVLAGDFNAQIGKDNTHPHFNYESKKRLHHESTNENGKILSELVLKCHLRPFISQKDNSSECFTFNDGKLKSQQSYIFVPFLRESFAAGGNIVWHPNYNHALVSQGIICKVDDMFHFKPEVESEKAPPLVVASWNIQNAIPAKVDAAVNKNDMPIVCIQELFLTSDEDIQTDNYTWLSTKKMWAKNVGILVKKSSNIVISNFEPVSEYLCIATLSFYEKPIIVMSFHLPSVSDSQYEQIVTQTKEKIKSLSEESVIILGGDFCSAVKTENEFHSADDFIEIFAKETELSSITNKRSKLITQISEAGKHRSNYVLVSQAAVKALYSRVNFRWIPFFEYALIYVFASENNVLHYNLNFENIRALDKPVMEIQTKTEDEITTKKVIITYKLQNGLAPLENVTSPLSEEDREKFKTSPPSADELSKIFKDFAVFQSIDRFSNVLLTSVGILKRSFLDCRVGNFAAETTSEHGKDKSSNICRIIWNDIVLAEETAMGSKERQELFKKTAQSLIAKLSQTCYTVKAKKSYFNNGLQPLLMDDPALAPLLKKVEKSSFSTVEEVYKHIDEFSSEDTDAELIFGKDFSLHEKFNIAKYAYNKDGLLDFRFFKSKADNLDPDMIAVFKKRTAQELRDMLIKEPNNFKYALIPPCGVGVNYAEFIKKENLKLNKVENTLRSKLRNKANKKPEVKQVQKLGQSTGRGDSGLTNPRSQQSRRSREVRERPSNRNSRQSVQSQPLGRDSSMRSGPRARGNPRSQGRRSSFDSYSSPRQNRNSQYSGGRKRDNRMMNASYDRFNQSSLYLDRSGMFHPIDSYQNDSYQNDNYFGSGGGFRQNDSYFENSPSNKRQRLERRSNGGSMMEMPDWRSIRPLLIVWPITIRSQLEDRPEIVLSENFNVEYKSDHGVTSVCVTLTHYSGSAKSYCIGNGYNARDAAGAAVEVLEKHCTVIKPSQEYLCDGFTPNFIRYRVPCQLNPRTYMFLGRADTGQLTTRVLEDLVRRFLNTFEEEIYFDSDSYSLDEKMAIVEKAPKLAPGKLMARHFGDSPKLIDRYVCLYKPKAKHLILQEVLQMKGEHPRYNMVNNKLPPEMGNIF